MDKERQVGIITFAAVSALSALFVSNANIYQDQFAQKVCEKALFVYGDDIRKQMDMIDLNVRTCEIAIDEVERSNVGRWFVGALFSSVIVGAVIKSLD
jgi:hypothetical protein